VDNVVDPRIDERGRALAAHPLPRGGLSGSEGHGIRSNEHRVGDLEDLRRGHVDTRRVLADLLRARGLANLATVDGIKRRLAGG
jgi:hypothetical protein